MLVCWLLFVFDLEFCGFWFVCCGFRIICRCCLLFGFWFGDFAVCCLFDC